MNYVGPYNILPKKTENRIPKTYYYYKNVLRWWDGKKLRNKAKIKEYNKEYRDKPGKKAKRKEYKQKPKNKARAKELADKPKRKDKKLKKRRERYKTDLPYKLTQLLRARHRAGLKRQNVEKTIDVLELMGCSLKFLITHLKSQFEEGMIWDNHGGEHDCWNIEHRRCYASLKLKHIEEQRKCCHWTNLQPMWKPENEAKGSDFDEATFEYKWIDKKTGWIKK